MIEVSSDAVFHAEHEQTLRGNYEEKNGRKLFIYDKSMDEIREATYTVSDAIRVFRNCEEVFI